MAQKSRRETGSTPLVGSSRNRIRGRCSSVHISASFCFMPPESLPPCRVAERLHAGHAQQPLGADRAALRPRCRTGPRRRSCSLPRSDPGTGRSAAPCSRSGLSPPAIWRAMSSPATRALPSVGSIRPHSMRRVVVLPAPSGPTSPKISPSATDRFRRSTAVMLAEAPRQIVRFDDRPACVNPARSPRPPACSISARAWDSPPRS